jgi:Hsp20/alpha crystallin family
VKIWLLCAQAFSGNRGHADADGERAGQREPAPGGRGLGRGCGAARLLTQAGDRRPGRQSVEEFGCQHAPRAPVGDDGGNHDPVIGGEQLPQPPGGTCLAPEVELAPGVPYGTFTRQVFLGETLDADHIAADYAAGVLTLTIPVREAAKPRSIQVTSSDQKQAVTA